MRVDPGSVKELREFVDHLLLLRGGSPLDTCEFTLGKFQNDDVPRMNLWVRHVILWKVRVLRLRALRRFYLVLDDLPLVSRHLTRLELQSVRVTTSLLDFSSCPTLEHLELLNCFLFKAKKMVSESLKHLSIIRSSPSGFLFDHYRTCIYAPNLVSLRLDDLERTPMLDGMPSLVDAFVRIAECSLDCCDKLLDPDCLDCICGLCSGNIRNSGNSCVLLKGLSQAKSLELISVPDMIIFKSDLRWRPVFGNLKTLLLNDCWCAPDDFDALACILEHSPVLEKLTLQLFSEGPKHKVEMKGGYSLMGPSATISEHLKIVEVKCEEVDERVLKVLKFLCTFNICFTF